jgi:amino acid permease
MTINHHSYNGITTNIESTDDNSVENVPNRGESPRLRKELGWFQLTLLGIGCSIGAGIFVVTGIVVSINCNS